MSNPLNESLGISENTENPERYLIIDYSKHRDIFWQKRYPVSRLLYLISMVFGYFLLFVGVVLTLALVSGEGILKDFGFLIVAFGFFSAIILLFISEVILFQIDKNFFSYLDVRDNLLNAKS